MKSSVYALEGGGEGSQTSLGIAERDFVFGVCPSGFLVALRFCFSLMHLLSPLLFVSHPPIPGATPRPCPPQLEVGVGLQPCSQALCVFLTRQRHRAQGPVQRCWSLGGCPPGPPGCRRLLWARPSAPGSSRPPPPPLLLVGALPLFARACSSPAEGRFRPLPRAESARLPNLTPLGGGEHPGQGSSLILTRAGGSFSRKAVGEIFGL